MAALTEQEAEDFELRLSLLESGYDVGDLGTDLENAYVSALRAGEAPEPRKTLAALAEELGHA